MRLYFSFAILCILSVGTLITGLRGLFVKRAVVYPARRRYWIVVLGLAPITVSMIEMMFDPDLGSFDLVALILVLMTVGLLIYSWWELSGYTASGVTNESFQSALYTSLEKLNLPYKESLPRVELTSMGAYLQASFKPWRGIAELKMKQRKHKQTLRDIAQNMNEYYKHTPVKVNLVPSIIDIALGIMGLAMLIYLTVQQLKLGA